MKNYVKPGDHLTLVAPASVKSGDLVKVGSLIGVAQYDALAGEEVEIVRKGCFTLPKVSAQAWDQGDKIYWIDATAKCTKAASGNTLIGAAVMDAADPSDGGLVLLDGVIR
jgi:predicted RecA/RadA family phage recombinase